MRKKCLYVYNCFFIPQKHRADGAYRL